MLNNIDSTANARLLYDAIAKYYDYCTNDKDIDLCIYEKWLRNCHHIVDIGCGTGRVVKHLLNAGLPVRYGVDISTAMLDIARKSIKSCDLKFIYADLTKQRVNIQVDGAVLSWFMLNYMLTDNEVQEFLQILVKYFIGSVNYIAMELFYPRSLQCKYKETTNIYMPNGTVQKYDVRIYDSNRKIETSYITYSDCQRSFYVTRYRHFINKQTISNILKSVGFEEVYIVDDYNFDNLHPIQSNEATYNKYIVLARQSL